MYSVHYYSSPRTGRKYFFRDTPGLPVLIKQTRGAERALLYAAFIVKDKSGKMIKDRGTLYPICAGIGLRRKKDETNQ